MDAHCRRHQRPQCVSLSEQSVHGRNLTEFELAMLVARCTALRRRQPAVQSIMEFSSGRRTKQRRTSRTEPPGAITTDRRRRQRSDSVSHTLLGQRAAHRQRIEEVDLFDVEVELLNEIQQLRLGRRKGSTCPTKAQTRRRKLPCRATFGDRVPIQPSLGALPQTELMEVALLGRSNCGKSSLVNALTGNKPTKGPAAVSDRAGWTDTLDFYALHDVRDLEVGDLLMLVDMPGASPTRLQLPPLCTATTQ